MCTYIQKCSYTHAHTHTHTHDYILQRCVAMYVCMTNSADLPTATNIRNVSEICVTSFNISWDLSYSTCEDVTYEVSISPPPVEGNAIAFTYNMFYSITGLNMQQSS